MTRRIMASERSGGVYGLLRAGQSLPAFCRSELTVGGEQDDAAGVHEGHLPRIDDRAGPALWSVWSVPSR